jgi:hypothetical protein
MKEQVTVLIPLFGNNLSEYEIASLRSCNEHLNSFPITFIKAESNQCLEQAQELCPSADFVSFDDRYFSNQFNYTKLLLSENLYAQFGWSKYLLINELKAEINKNELSYWCRQGFDFVQGAVPCDQQETIQDKLFKRLNTSNYLYTKDKTLTSFEELGGLSLRLVERCWKIVKNNKRTINSFLSNRKEAINDSIFWEYYINRWWPQLNVPNEIARSRFIQLLNSLEIQEIRNEPFAQAPNKHL